MPKSSELFIQEFKQITGYQPFRWQVRLYNEHFSQASLPEALDLPTGLGKTSVMVIWYLALKHHGKIPRRLVYVVDRRAVVDQATTEAEKLRNHLQASSHHQDNLRISTLRGQHLDNRRWLECPSEPAIIVGTVDMIGSRLLFSGYGVSRKMRPYHAGLLGVDTLLILDEAHLVPAFESLLTTLNHEAHRFGPRRNEDQQILPPFHLLALSATGRDTNKDPAKIFTLSSHDQADAVVRTRLQAEKHLELIRLTPKADLVAQLAQQALELAQLSETSSRILVYCHSRKDAVKVRVLIDKLCRQAKLKAASQLLIGGRRILERAQLAQWLQECGFSSASQPVESGHAAVFLVATSAGEVGVDLDAHHMVCDLVSWERMIQRLGRVNRRGRHRSLVKVLVAPSPKQPHDYATWLKPIQHLPDQHPPAEATFIAIERSHLYNLETSATKSPAGELLGQYNASLEALLELKARASTDPATGRVLTQATSEAPFHPPLSRAMVDAWSMTSLDEHPARPESIEPWLRGWQDNPQPQTTVLWRKFLPLAQYSELHPEDMSEFFKKTRPHLAEKLELEVPEVVDWLFKRAKQKKFFAAFLGSATPESDRTSTPEPDPILLHRPVCLILSSVMELRMSITPHDLLHQSKPSLKRFKDRLKQKLAHSYLIVDQRFGGLATYGILDAKAHHLPPVIDEAAGSDEPDHADAFDFPERPFRIREVSHLGEHEDPEWHESYQFELEKNNEGETLRWLIVEKSGTTAMTEDDRAMGRHPQELAEHQAWTMSKAQAIAHTLNLPPAYAQLLIMAARLHDEGKRHQLWQETFHAPQDGRVYAKTAGPVHPNRLDGYRHEFGSLSYVTSDDEFTHLPAEHQDLVLHLVAAHHGHARPVISVRNGLEPPSMLAEAKLDIARRFAALQHRWGPWGLAWWESLLRAADQQASRDNDRRSNQAA